jgi:predicted nucleic acid-binding protein
MPPNPMYPRPRRSSSITWRGERRLIIPSLLYYEVGNILLFGRSRPSTEQAADALTDLFSIPIEVASPALVNAEFTLRLASLRGLTYYDATYVALAEVLDCPLITADQRLAERARATGRVRLLGKD